MSYFFNAALRGACGGLLAVVLSSGGALAQTGGKVQAVGLTKNGLGTVLAMDIGEEACILTLRDDKGAIFQEMAESSICRQQNAIKGQRVALTYTQARVPADECQGNPDCRKSRVIALVNAVRLVDGGRVQVAGQPVASPAGTGQASFCTAKENVVFACATGTKLVSVCASKDASRSQGYVQYRFGNPQTQDMEMSLPQRTSFPADSATADSESFSGGGGSWMRFRSGAVSYVVYDGVGKWGPLGQTVEKRGVIVERSGKSAASLHCAGKPVNNMSRELFDQLGLTRRNGEDFDFSQ